MHTTLIALPKTAKAAASVALGDWAIPGKYQANGVPNNQATLLHGRLEVLLCVVAHDDSLRKDVHRLLQSQKYPVEFFPSAQAFLHRKIHSGPCCLILDDHLPGLSGLSLQNLLSHDGRTEQIIFVSGRSDVFTCAQAFKAGAADFLAKPLKNSELLRAVENGLLRSERLCLLRLEALAAQTLLDQLTPREREVLRFVIAGQINKEIADELGTGEKTIKKHRGQLMRKLRVGSVAELVHFSLRHGVKPARPYGTKVPYTSTY